MFRKGRVYPQPGHLIAWMMIVQRIKNRIRLASMIATSERAVFHGRKAKIGLKNGENILKYS